MKRLITQFTRLWRVEDAKRDLMALVLFSFVSMCYGNGYIHIWKADGTGDVGNYLISYNGATGTASFNMQANVKYGITLWDFPKGDINSTPKNEYGFSNSTVGSDSKYKLEGTGAGYIESPIGGTCSFKVEWNGSTPYLTVSYKVKDKLRYKLTGTDIYAYADLTYDNFGNGISNINLYDDKTYEFQISNGDGNWYGNTGTITSNCTEWGFDTNTNACKIQTSSKGSNPNSYSRVYTLNTKWNNGLKVSVTYQNVGDYYLIVPNENVGNTPRAISESWVPTEHKAFKIAGARERNQTILNPELTSVTLKIDGQQLHYNNNKQIRFYIYDKANNRYYQPNADTEITQMYFTSNGRDGVGRSHDDIKSTATGKYYYINEEAAKTTIDGQVYPTKSLTFMFSQYDAEKNFYNNDKVTLDGHFTHGNSIYYVNGEKRVLGNAKLMVAFLKTRGVGSMYYNEHITKSANGNEAGVYLVGNMGGDGYKNGSESDYDKSKYKMTRNLWKDGKIRTDIDVAAADSIVYSCEIKKGDASWDNFFLSFTTGDVLGQDSKMWNPLLRPRVQNKMDAQALEGGIFYYLSTEGHGADQAQSLNPLLTEDQKKRYASYHVYFNATYSTYRIEFHDGFYIGGPAVNNIDDNNDTGNNFESNFRKDMTFVEAYNGIPAHYMYKGNFKKGSTFAFFLNKETYIDNYSEDGDDTKNQFVINNDKDMWNTQAPTEANEGADYPFFNKVLFNNTGDNDTKSLGTGKKAIKWTLPDGEYTLRFYNHAENGGVNPFYTIDKTIKMKNVTSTFANAEGEEATAHNYGGWRTFSDDCAMWVPNDVEAYYISSINGQKQVVLTPVPNNYIPAHCGVVLYYKNLTTGDAELSLKPYSILDEGNNAQYTKKLGVTNLLEDCYDKAVGLKQYADGKYSYILTYKYQKGNGVSGEVPLNFWKSLSTVTVSKNSSYMKVPEYINPAAFNEKTNNYIFASNSDANSRSHCFILPFEDFDDSYVVTGITSIDNDSNNSGDSNVWYTIQGVKVASPVMPGIYIHNGKKIIIK